MPSHTSERSRHAFTLVELLVVIGIIGLLIGILLPSLHRAQIAAKSALCKSNLRQVGMQLSIYSMRNRGILFPMGPDNEALGGLSLPEERWTMLAFGKWNPPIMFCPVSEDPAYEHSYVLNFQLIDLGYFKTSSHIDGWSASEVVLMGEKFDHMIDYFVHDDTYKVVVEEHKHGIQNGSNGLYLDGHVAVLETTKRRGQRNPWEPATHADPIAPIATP